MPVATSPMRPPAAKGPPTGAAGSSRSRSRSRSRSLEEVAGAGQADGAEEVVWFRYYSEEGHPYYHQTEAGQTVWEQPSGSNVRVVDGASAPPAGPLTWYRCCTPEGLFYYDCPAAGRTVWELPSDPNDSVVDHPAIHRQKDGGPGGCELEHPDVYGYGRQQDCLPADDFPRRRKRDERRDECSDGRPAFIPARGSDRLEAFIARSRVDNNAAARLRSLAPEYQAQIMDRGDLQAARNPNAVLMCRIKELVFDQRCHGTNEMVENFIVNNGIDHRAADRLRGLPAPMQFAVVSKGDVTLARNPSAVIFARIKEVKIDMGCY